MRNEDIFVYGFWAGAALLALLFIGEALIAGSRDHDPKSLLKWRRVKLGASLLGVVGLALLLVSFEDLVRGSLKAGSKEYAEDRFLEIKLILTQELGTVCAKDDPRSVNACGLLRNIDNQLYVDRIRRGEKLSYVTDWQRADIIPVSFQEGLNRRIERLNEVTPTVVLRSTFTIEGRIQLAGMAVLFVILAIAGSVGEAAYQYRMAKGT